MRCTGAKDFPRSKLGVVSSGRHASEVALRLRVELDRILNPDPTSLLFAGRVPGIIARQVADVF